ncbi:MAG: tRNA (N6-threonylcarbamoyladenosine(37)-N6)-methyltransferase TrmO [Fibrobacterota bacterium]|nr:tRNA (N6-threonylcarbamoyladenosine(37)-N6)-methyltransferase TrmO [Fibrobacterota bacterium]QQS04094.1 MAG: tRNA (N6-threonylcarbamoyladenosine(37)-N6)-methyltransferase TrmO [Fibrobacterota bacterium]
MNVSLEPIGILRTCFPEKLGIPRQPGLAPLARGVLEFSSSQPPEVWRHALDGLSGFSHVWLTFSFHKAAEQGWKPRIRPPRLDGREKIGVFATRSPHRPNFLGLSLCRLEHVDLQTPSVRVSGVDILDGTPILDLRPFHPENDVPTGTVQDGWLERAHTKRLQVGWQDPAKDALAKLLPKAVSRGFPAYELEEAIGLVEQLVSLDPRPAHLRGADGSWYMRILSFDVVATVQDGAAKVTEIRP